VSALSEIGEALYGPRWQCEMARALDVSSRTIRRWVANDADLPNDVAFRLCLLCEKRKNLLAGLSKRFFARS
jgi:plasmid maintenance system antidote protein VapI